MDIGIESRTLSISKDEQWSKFYEKELDALEWALEFMKRYEKKYGIPNRPK